MVRWVRRTVEEAFVQQDVVVQIRSISDVKIETIGVCIQHIESATVVAWNEEIVKKAIHMPFRQIEHCCTDVHGFIATYFCRFHLYSDYSFVYYIRTMVCRLSHKTLKNVFIVH